VRFVSDRSIVDVTPVCERVHMDRSSDVANLAEIAIPSAASDDAYDYGADADPDDEAVARAFAELDKLTLTAERLTEQRKRAEDQLQKVKQAEEQLLNKDIPELLARMRLDDCTTASGIHVKVKREIKASLPGHERVEARMGALRWLVDHGHGGVIKNQVSVALDRGDDARADELVVELRGKGYDVEAKKDVHASTLGALVRELVAEGKIVPREFFNLFDMRIAKLTRK
jgi:hypothetical protein